MRKNKKYVEDLLENLQDLEEAAEYLNIAMQDVVDAFASKKKDFVNEKTIY